MLETELAVNTHPDIIRLCPAMNIRTTAGAILTMAAVAWAAPTARAQPITTNLHVGDFTYQFADPTTGQPITSLIIPGVGPPYDRARVAVYLVQQGGTPTNLLQQLGVEGIGVRLNYANPAGIVRVPNATNNFITARPPPVNNPNTVFSDYFVQRYGAGTGTNTATSAAISNGLINVDDPLPFPGAEDPMGNGNRMLVGTFTLESLVYTEMEQVTAVSGPSIGVNSLTGPNPPIIGLRNDGTIGRMPGNAVQGEVYLDQFLAQNPPTLTVYVAIPEPSTLALGFLAAAGLAVWRRRMAGTVAA
jgi:hypothetical protein